MNKICSFELAKLLFEKGFDKSLCGSLFNIYDIEDEGLMKDVEHDVLIKGKGFYYHAPTIAEIVDYLLEKHNINLYVLFDGKWWYYQINKLDDLDFCLTQFDFSEQDRQQALENGIIYCLNEIIK